MQTVMDSEEEPEPLPIRVLLPDGHHKNTEGLLVGVCRPMWSSRRMQVLDARTQRALPRGQLAEGQGDTGGPGVPVVCLAILGWSGAKATPPQCPLGLRFGGHGDAALGTRTSRGGGCTRPAPGQGRSATPRTPPRESCCGGSAARRAGQPWQARPSATTAAGVALRRLLKPDEDDARIGGVYSAPESQPHTHNCQYLWIRAIAQRG